MLDCKILDEAAVVHLLPPSTCLTFADYAEIVFIPHLLHELSGCHNLDVVWDRYITGSIKECAREKRGCGKRMKVGCKIKIPLKWNDFWRDSENKVELFDFLTDTISKMAISESKSCYITNDTSGV